MGRSTKKGVDYFQHDTDASEKTTVFALEAKFGNDGYAFWFKLLEMMGKKENLSIDCGDRNEWYHLLHKMRVDEQKAEKIIELLAELNAIDAVLWNQARIIWSDNFVSRLSVLYGKRKEGVPRKPLLSDQEEETVPDAEIKVSAAEKPISEEKKPITAAETPISEDDSEEIGPFGLTVGDMRRAQDEEDAIERTARRNGINIHDAQMDRAKELAAKYGLEALLDAMNKAGSGKSQAWYYIEGILRKQAAKPAAATDQYRPPQGNPFAEYMEDKR